MDNSEAPSARRTGIKILNRFENTDSYLDRLLNAEYKNPAIGNADKALMTELVYGVTRNRTLLDFILSQFYYGNYEDCDISLKNAMRIALYQIKFLERIPDSAAVNESVEFVKKNCGISCSRVANGVLRNYLRHPEKIKFPDKSTNQIQFLSVTYSHPEWMIKRFLQIFGENDTEKLLARDNEIPATIIRVNTLKSSAVEVSFNLLNDGIDFTVSPFCPSSFAINDRRFRAASSKIFREGAVTAQDTSATMAAMLSNAKPGDRILDMCAAPGGKSFVAAELSEDKGSITALDKFPAKLDAMHREIERLGYKSIHVIEGDATTFSDDEKFDLVLCDVPCSGLGVLAKKPDIKWQRKPQEINKMIEIQQKILDNASTLVKSGGAIVYSTCTIEPNENFLNIYNFLAKHSDFSLDPAENHLSPEVCQSGMMQTFPQIHNIDGAFAARLIKK